MTKLNAAEPQPVTYCIPIWLRDEQIKLAIERVAARIQPGEKTDEPIAIVGFGPTLQQTWERIREFKHVITCSGAHRFLLERGITPEFHVEVDPRAHKVELIGPPDPNVKYLIASTCHPHVFDHLAGMDVRLWHVFDGNDEAMRVLPAGEWAITGGCDAGLRAITIAAFLGFRDLHVFGLDGCLGPDQYSHAAAHPNAVKNFAEVEFGGRTYLSTPALLEAARGVKHELSMLPGARATFYGDALIQAMMHDFKPEAAARPLSAGNIAFSKPVLISADYRELNAQLHSENLAYGVGGGKHADTVQKLAEALKTRSILDYGCGKGYLGKALAERGIPIWEYDPAIAGKDESPRPADLVACTDVLEHIEPDRLHFVLDDLRRCVKQVGYFVIHTGPSSKALRDGRNAHLIQRNRAWWKIRLSKFFTIGKIIETPPLLYVVVGPKALKARKAA